VLFAAVAYHFSLQPAKTRVCKLSRYAMVQKCCKGSNY
jgi:hypothetical protein